MLPHSSYFLTTEVRIFRIELGFTWLRDLCDRSTLLDRQVDFDRGLLPTLATRLYREFREMDDLAPLAIEGLVLEMLALGSRHSFTTAKRRPPRWLEHAREILHAHFPESLHLKQIAKSVGVHPVYLAQGFRSYHGWTVKNDGASQIRG